MVETEEIINLKKLLTESGYSPKIADIIIDYYLKPTIF